MNATFGNAGSIIAPLILEYLDYWLFLFVFAIVCTINSLLLFCLPETNQQNMFINSIKKCKNIRTISVSFFYLKHGDYKDDLRCIVKDIYGLKD